MNAPHNGFISNRVLKLNVGFLLNESIGSKHEMAFDVPQLIVADDLRLAYLRGPLRLTRASEGILIQGKLAVAIEAECSRCLYRIPVPLSLDLEELFAQHDHTSSEFFIGEDGILDLAPLLREETILATPMAPACVLDPEGLCPFGHALADLKSYLRQDDDIDPRFAVLLQLRNQSQDTE